MLRAPKKNKNKNSYDVKNLEVAVEKVKSGELSIRKAAEEYKIPKSTIGDRVSGKRDIEVGRGRKPALPSALEDSIVETVKKASEIGVGITRQQLLSRTGTLVKRLKLKTPFTNSIPGKDWWQGVKSRHPDLSIRKPEKTGDLRCRMMNRTKVEEYFTDIGNYLSDNGLMDKPHRIWNMDETGKNFEHDPVKVIAQKGSRNIPGRTCSPGTHVTIVACVNAIGQRLAPLVIAAGKTERSLYGFNTTEAPKGTLWDFQQNGWIDDRIGERWFKELFLPQCGPERPQLLILDGHSSHESLAIIEEGIKENIGIISLPPHTTHWLQPLDRSVFGPFNNNYDKACAEFLQENVLHKIDKWTFPTVFRTAWNAGLSKENIKSGFRACGIVPFNPSAIPESAYLPSQPTENVTEVSENPSLIKNVNFVPEISLPGPHGEGNQTKSATQIPLSHQICPSGDNFPKSFPSTSSATDMEIDDPENLLQLILDDKIQVVATADESGVATLTDWNAEINNLFLPVNTPPTSEFNANQIPSTSKSKKSKQSHRLLTSDDIVKEKRLLQQRKEEREQKKMKKQLVKGERTTAKKKKPKIEQN